MHNDVENQLNEYIKKQEIKDKIVFHKIETFINNKMEKALSEEIVKLKESIKFDLTQQAPSIIDDKNILDFHDELNNMKLEFFKMKVDLNDIKNEKSNDLIMRFEKIIEDKQVSVNNDLIIRFERMIQDKEVTIVSNFKGIEI